jgi:hypothetical protein
MSFFRSIVQNVQADSANSSTANINAGDTWNSAGAGTSTLGVAGIQVNIYMSQNATVYVDQSQEGTNWDITDTFSYYTPMNGASWTVQATASYVRVRVKNTGTATATTVRIQTALCPIVEAVPRALDLSGNLKVGVKNITGSFGKEVKVSPMGALKQATTTRLTGTSFWGTTVDTNFWASTPTNNGSATQSSGELTLNTNTTTPNGSVIVQSVRTARYTAASPNYYRGVVRLPAVTTSTGTNTRRWGAYDVDNGFFFEANQANLAVTPILTLVCRKTAGDTNRVVSGAFNGTQGLSFLLDNNVHVYEIYWSNSNAWFFIDDVLIHTFSGATATLVDTTSLKIGLETINAGTNQVNNTLVVRSSTINRFGQLVTQPQYRYQSGTTTGVIAKYGPGNLHTVIISSQVQNSVVTIYDGTTTGGTVMFAAAFAAANNSLNPTTIDFQGVPFSTGLFLVIATQNSNVTLIYE